MIFLTKLLSPWRHRKWAVRPWLGVVLGMAAMGALWAAPSLHVYTVLGPDQRAVLRSISTDSTCPTAHWNNAGVTRLQVRSSPAKRPPRPDQAQAERTDTDWPVWVCEAPWPDGASTVQVQGQVLKGPQPAYRKILILGDTGCRLKSSEKAYQDCNDPKAWPFPTLMQKAVALQPDLVIHMGDIHYRESPCPSHQAGCAGSVWGYGWTAWEADFFEPAKPLLQVPWVGVRGNHESCARAGQGWMRFMDPLPFEERRSCDDPRHDVYADFTAPYSVSLNERTRVWVFDSSKASGKVPPVGDAVAATHLAQLAALQQAPVDTFNVFASHHPYNAWVNGPQGRVRDAGTAGLKSVLRSAFGTALLPPQFQLTIHGHVHMFEALVAEPGHASTLILGNSGSMMEAMPAQQGGDPLKLANGSWVKQLISQPGYGFALLEHETQSSSTEWLLTEYDTQAQALARCKLSPEGASCQIIQSTVNPAHE